MVKNMTQKQIEKLSLEQAFEEIDNLMNEMSGDDIELDKSFELYKDGMQLLKHCSDKIEQVEKQVKLMNEEGGLDDF